MRQVLVIGAAHWDLIGRASGALRPGADLPGQVAERPGGVALNIARSLAAAGLRPVLLSAVGRDAAGDRLLAGIAAEGVEARHVLRATSPTGRYLAIEDPTGLFAAVADCASLEAAGHDILAPLTDGRLASAAQPWRGTAVIDGNLPGSAFAACLAAPGLAGAELALVAASSRKAARLAPALGRKDAVLYLNRAEAERLAGRSFDDSRAAAEALAASGIAGALVTDGPAPASWGEPGRIVTLRPPDFERGGVTGAGDALLAAHLLARARGLDAEAALTAALEAASRHMTGSDLP